MTVAMTAARTVKKFSMGMLLISITVTIVKYNDVDDEYRKHYQHFRKHC